MAIETIRGKVRTAGTLRRLLFKLAVFVDDRM